MSRVLLLCFVHGFKGTDNTFHEFPKDLLSNVKKELPDHQVESVVYPKYETTGELAQASQALLEWVKERVMELRKQHCKNPWPPNDRDVGVVFVAHSMGGFVAADALFLAINEREANGSSNDQLFPLIQGILAFDTPYNGLARSMFVYGAFSNYQKVSTVFNAMTALSAAAPAAVARLGARNAVTSSTAMTSGSKWATWQLLAVRTGTVGAIAAGGVTAYKNREAIMSGVKKARNLNKESIAEGYRQTLGTLGHGLAYINRGNVGKSFAYLSEHFVFVGALLKQKELSRRLERIGALKGVGVHDYFCSLGENGYWSGGYFVPERTFCAVPDKEHAAHGFFSREIMPEVDDEIQAHLSLFKPDKHEAYEKMTEKSASLVKEWFLNDDPIIDDERFREVAPEEKAEDNAVDQTLESPDGDTSAAENLPEPEKEKGGDELPDESPLDITAAASLVPLPGSEGNLMEDTNLTDADSDEKKTYVQHLFNIAQNAGTGVKGWWPTNVPSMPAMPAIPKVPASVSSLSPGSIPGANLLSRKQAPAEQPAEQPAEPTPGGATTESAPTESAPTESAPAENASAETAPTENAPTNPEPVEPVTAKAA